MVSFAYLFNKMEYDSLILSTLDILDHSRHFRDMRAITSIGKEGKIGPSGFGFFTRWRKSNGKIDD